ncbi:MAG: hypothetical protein H6R19_2268 [Proteobacteria bacterium]|nr:hypothetical protein [Pseudomonadota bacterium]
MRVSLIVLSLMALLASLNVSAEVYRWTDKDGKVHYSDAPPPEVDAQPRRLHDNNIGVDKLPYETRKAAEKFPITLYLDENCKDPCSSARQWLQQRKLPFGEKVLKTKDDGEAFKQLTGKPQVFVPTLSIGSKFIEGFEPGEWSNAMTAAGYPK